MGLFDISQSFLASVGRYDSRGQGSLTEVGNGKTEQRRQ
jgi:hypothetical protein